MNKIFILPAIVLILVACDNGSMDNQKKTIESPLIGQWKHENEEIVTEHYRESAYTATLTFDEYGNFFFKNEGTMLYTSEISKYEDHGTYIVLTGTFNNNNWEYIIEDGFLIIQEFWFSWMPAKKFQKVY